MKQKLSLALAALILLHLGSTTFSAIKEIMQLQDVSGLPKTEQCKKSCKA